MSNIEVFTMTMDQCQAPSWGLADPQLQKDLSGVKQVSLDSVATAAPVIKKSLTDIVNAGGKMLRPALVIVGARYGIFNEEKIFSLAASVEMIHNATLIHDDIIDEAPTRRGNPALHAVYGNTQAVLIGDYLLSSSFILAAQATTGTNALVLAKGVSRVCEGEINQNAGRFSDDFSLRSYKRRIAAKTAALFGVALVAGAREAGVADVDCAVMARIGYNLGMAFQIIDDILDYTGNDVKVGKPLGRDLLEGIYTLPLLSVLKNDGRGDLEKLVANKPYSEKSALEIVNLVVKSGGVKLAQQEAELYTNRGLREVARLKPGYTRSMLESIIGQLLTRQK